MENPNKLYHPQGDARYASPYIDKREQRESPFSHLYVHGGFRGTNTRFSLYYPPAASYQSRFYQLLTPVQGSEDASQKLIGDEDNIGFAISHGAYFVQSNLGGNDSEHTTLFRSSAAVAEYSRCVAKELYGEHRTYGYVYGGSGGGFKTMSCVENTEGIWDGSVPYIIGSPMAIPYMYTIRAHAFRILRNRFSTIIDAVEPGGNGDMYAGLNIEERDALMEITNMGFPPGAWFSHKIIGDGDLPILAYAVDQMDPAYYTDFWTTPGYLGADPNGSAVRDRFRHFTRVKAIILPEGKGHYHSFHKGDVHDENAEANEATQQVSIQYETEPAFVMEDAPGTIPYNVGTKIVIASGAAAGLKLPMGKITGNTVNVGSAYGMGDIASLLEKIRPGDEIILDNSDYIALQTYHRHQVPDEYYAGWEQYRDENGNPIYPQRPELLGPKLVYHAAGSVQSGKINGKMIVVASLLDECAMPWQPDWYRNKVTEFLGSKANDNFRLWYNDNAMHSDNCEYYNNEIYSSHIISYRSALYQALLDLSAWVEHGVEPPQSTAYEIINAQVVVPNIAKERKGIQPLVTLTANGNTKAAVSIGETIELEGSVDVPPNAGKITSMKFVFDGDFVSSGETLFTILNDEGTSAKAKMICTAKVPGTYFPSLRVTSNKNDPADTYTQIKNLARVRVVIE